MYKYEIIERIQILKTIQESIDTSQWEESYVVMEPGEPNCTFKVTVEDKLEQAIEVLQECIDKLEKMKGE